MQYHRASHQSWRYRKDSGYVIILALVVAFILSGIGLSLASVAAAKYSKTRRDAAVVAANYAAEAGISDTISRLNDDLDFAGFYPGSETEAKTFYDDASGRAVYNTQVTATANPITKTIKSTGVVYKPGTSTIVNKKVIAVTVNRNTEPSTIAVAAGPGGLTIEGGSSLYTSNVFSSGKITMDTSSLTLGSSGTPAQVGAANASCSSGSSYPVVCPTSSPAISIGASSGGIIGTVCATNQPDTVGIDSSSLDKSCSPVRNIINTSSRPALYSGLTSQTAPSPCTSGSRTIPANVSYTGNVSFSGGCSATLTGTLLVQGDLTISGTSTSLIVPDSLGNVPVIVMATGKITIDGATVNTNSSGASVRFISFRSNTTCSTTATCTRLTSPTDVQTSLDLPAIECLNGCKAHNAQLTAYFGRINLQGSSGNQAYVRSVAAQKIVVLANSSTISTTNTAGNTLSDVVQARWAIVDYKQVYE